MRYFLVPSAAVIALATIVLAMWDPSAASAQQAVPLVRYNAYDVVEEDSADDLADAVTNAIHNGWQPVGGVSMDEGRYLQAIGR